MVPPPRAVGEHLLSTSHTRLPPHQHQDDSDLIRRCLSGDAAAWHILVDRYSALVYSVAVRRGLPPDACDDIYQGTMLLLLKNLAAVRDHRSLAKWLIVTARRECARAVAARQRENMAMGALPAPSRADENDPPLAELERLEWNRRVWAALDRLSPRCRELLTALFAGGDRPDYQSIATRIGIPVGSIGPTRARCLGQLLELLEDDGPRAV